MFKLKKGTIWVLVVLVVSVFIFYRYAVKVIQSNNNCVLPVPTTDMVPAGPRELSTIISYEAYDGGHFDTLRFVLGVDDQGVIQSVKTLDAVTNEVPEKKKEFNELLTVIIVGKKLSDLTALDKVGQSSRTTTAFNRAIDPLKAQF